MKNQAFIDSLLEKEAFHAPLIFYGDNAEYIEQQAEEFAKKILEKSIGKAVALNNHPDLRCFGPEGKSFSMDSIRAFIEEISLFPHEGRYRIYVFKQIDTLLPVHANALLKTLEEKPEFSVVVLSTNQLSKVLPTIQSRCQCIHFTQSIENTVSPDLLKLVLQAIHASIDGLFISLFSLISKIDEHMKENKEHVTAVLQIVMQWVLDCKKMQNNLSDFCFPQGKKHYSKYQEKISCHPDFFLSIEKDIELALERNFKSKSILEYIFLSFSQLNT